MNDNVNVETQTLLNILMAKVNALTSENIVKDSVIETLNMKLLQYRSKEADELEESQEE